MPYADPEIRSMLRRNRDRNQKHPGWRQVFYDSNGMCSICGSTEYLEFHAPFGEHVNGERVIICWECHKKYDYNYPMNMDHSYELSKLVEDVDADIKRLGGIDKWMQKYKIVEKGAIA